MTAEAATIEAKIVVLGTQGVGKTSLVHRYVKNAFIPPSKAQSTVGASFLTSRIADAETGIAIRLQIWDTAGQERFRSISKLYYRGAHAAILCYDITSAQSFKEMGRWLEELRDQCAQDMIIHVVGTKSDVVAAEPDKREITMEQCIEYVAGQIGPELVVPGKRASVHMSPVSNRSSGLWGADSIWDCCHEVSAKDGEGIDEVFRVITKKLIEQHMKRLEVLKTPATESGPGYFDVPTTGSFRLGMGDKRRSWLGLATPGLSSYHGEDEQQHQQQHHGEPGTGRVRKGCC